MAFCWWPGHLGGWETRVPGAPVHSPCPCPHPGTEFEYTDSESEVKVRKRSPAGLLRPKKGLGEPGPSLAAPAPSARGPGPAGPDKAKLAAEKGRKARRLRGAKEPGFEAGPEASDDDLWTRRRSERIFLHDASAAAPAPSSAAPAATKPSRCGKGGPLSPRKDTGRAKDRKDPRKVGPSVRGVGGVGAAGGGPEGGPDSSQPRAPGALLAARSDPASEQLLLPVSDAVLTCE